MRCSKCDREVDASIGKCLYCAEAEAEKVRILTPEEKLRYQGVTIDTGGEDRESSQQYRRRKANPGFYIKQINLNGSSWLSKFMIFAILAAIAAFILLVALPVALVGIGVGVLVWIVLGFFKR